MKRVIIRENASGNIIFDQPYDSLSGPLKKEVDKAAKTTTFWEKSMKVSLFIVDDSTPSPVPTPTPTPTGDWKDKLNKQMFFFGAPTYFWTEYKEKEAIEIINFIADQGLTGPEIELNGPFPVYEYIGKRIKNLNVAQVYSDNIEKWKYWWLPQIRRRKLVASIKFLNSNQSDANQLSNSDWEALGLKFIKDCGTENMIILPLNETDTRTRSLSQEVVMLGTQIRNSIRSGLSKGGLPKTQFIDYSILEYGHFLESHPQKGTDIASSSLGYRYINCPDGGGSIKYLYGPSWEDGGSPDIANIKTYASTVKAKGTSGSIYSFSRKFDVAGCVAAGEIW